MNSEWEKLVPEQMHGAVREALAAVYGNRAVECLGEVTGGASGAVALAFADGSRRHLLRVEARRHPMRNPHQYACLATAAVAGIAPALHYVDAASGVALMDFIVAVPLDRFPGGDVARAIALAELRSKLQDTPPFSALGDWRAIIGRLLDLLETRCAPGLLDHHRETFGRLCEAVDWDPATHVSSHNDPNARNILFDGSRLWLVDWETAYRNDAMVDLAIMADNCAATPELTEGLLKAWLGRAAMPDEALRFERIRRLTRLYYAGLLIAFGGPLKGQLTDLSALTRAEAEEKVAKGELAEVTADSLLLAGKMCLAGFLEPV